MTLEELKANYLETKDHKVLTKIQELNSINGLTLKDAEYLQEFLTISEDFLGSLVSLEQAHKALDLLNERLATEICIKSFKNRISGSQFARSDYGYGDDDEDGESWCASAVC